MSQKPHTSFHSHRQFRSAVSHLQTCRPEQHKTKNNAQGGHVMLAASSAVAAPIAASRSSGVNTTQCISGRNTTRSNATFSGRTGQNAEGAGFHAAAPLSPARGCGALSRCVRAPHHAQCENVLRDSLRRRRRGNGACDTSRVARLRPLFIVVSSSA